MRDFFKQILMNLYIYVGNRQVEKMTDDEIKLLLDSLERMSKLYSYIPEEKQKEIILTQLIADREYQNINVRTVSKWLDLNGKIYFKEEAHEPTIEFKPATEEQKDFWMGEWKKQLAKIEDNLYPDRSKPAGSRMREQLDSAGVKFNPDKHTPIPEEQNALNEFCNEQASNEKGSEGNGEAPGISDDKSNQAEQNDSV